MQVALPLTRYPTPRETLRVLRGGRARGRSGAGRTAASFGDSLPLDGWNIGQGFEIVGDPPVETLAASRARSYQIVGTRYFDVLGIPLARGRAFGRARHRARRRRSASSAESFVARYRQGTRAARHCASTSRTWRMTGARAGRPRDRRRQRRRCRRAPAQTEHEDRDLRADRAEPLVSRRRSRCGLPAAPAGAAAGDQGGGRARRQGAAGDRVRTMEEVAAQATSAPRFRALLVGVFAVAGADARRHRHLRRPRVLRAPADARVRHPPGAGRAAGRFAPAGDARRPEGDRRRAASSGSPGRRSSPGRCRRCSTVWRRWIP